MDGLFVDDVLNSFGETKAKSQDVYVYGVTDRSSEPFWVRWDDFLIDRSRIPLKEKSYFFHLLSVMLDAGIPMLESLRILSTKSDNKRFQRIISTMAYYVEGGRPFSEALSKFPTVFDDAEIGVVKSGEAIGRLDEMLQKLSDQMERAYNIQLKLKGAMTYPIVVLTVLFLATIVVMTMVIPKLKVFFDSFSYSP